MGWADDMARFEHQADLTGLTVPQLVARLRGDYGDGVSYAATPLNLEAAKRLEAVFHDMGQARAHLVDSIKAAEQLTADWDRQKAALTDELVDLRALVEIGKTADRVVAQMADIVARASQGTGGCCKDCKFWGKNMFSGDDGGRECVNPKLRARICAESGDGFGQETSIQTQPEFGCIQFETTSTKP